MTRFVNPQPQYFSDLGLPLSEGNLYFYTTGTSSPLNTYSDAELTIPNPNPVPLDASGRPENDIFLNGVYKVVLLDMDDNLIWEKDPVGLGSESDLIIPLWVSDVAYQQNSIVSDSSGNFYISITNGNTGNNPSTSPSVWLRVEFITSYSASKTYSTNDIVRDASGFMWRSLTSGNINNTPSSSADYWDNVTYLSVTSVANIAALRNRKASYAGQQVNVTEYASGGSEIGGGTFYWNSSSTSADDSGSIIAVAGVPTGRWVRVGAAYSPENFGTVSGGSLTQNVFDAAQAAAVPAVTTALESVSLSANRDFNELVVIGSGTELVPNGRDMKDIGALVNMRQDDGSGTLPFTDKPMQSTGAIEVGNYKAVAEISGSIYVLTKGGSSRGGLSHKLVTGNVVAPSLPSDSLNTAWEPWRPAEVWPMAETYIYQRTADSETGSWTDFTQTQSGLNIGATTALRALTGRRSQLAGNTITYTAVADRKGRINVAFQTTTTSDTACEIRVDGVLVDTISLNTSAGLYVHEIKTLPGSHTVEMTHGNNTNLYVLGVNLYTLSEIVEPPQFNYDWISSYYESGVYISNDNAHDYAFRDKIDDLWGGSYHGGETMLEPSKFSADAAIVDPTATDYVKVCKSFNVWQRSIINWSTQSLQINNAMSWSDSKFQQHIVAVGELQALTYHTGMCGTNENFEILLSNLFINDVTATTATQKSGNTLIINQINPINGKKVINEISTTHLPLNSPDYGGSTVNFVSTLYNKIYFSRVRNTDQKVVNAAWVLTRTFC